MRNIYISGYRYNLDKKPRAALIEVGAQTNTVSEVKNAMEPLADIIYQVISGQ
jgi:stage II sporulation protein P